MVASSNAVQFALPSLGTSGEGTAVFTVKSLVVTLTPVDGVIKKPEAVE